MGKRGGSGLRGVEKGQGWGGEGASGEEGWAGSREVRAAKGRAGWENGELPDRLKSYVVTPFGVLSLGICSSICVTDIWCSGARQKSTVSRSKCAAGLTRLNHISRLVGSKFVWLMQLQSGTLRSQLRACVCVRACVRACERGRERKRENVYVVYS